MHRIYEEEKEFIQLIKETLHYIKNVYKIYKFKIYKNHPELIEKLEKILLKYPDYNNNVVFLIRCILFNIDITKYRCMYCNGSFGYSKIYQLSKLKQKHYYCSRKCRDLYLKQHPEIAALAQEKKKITCLKKYGVDHAWKNTEVKKKNKESVKTFWKTKYGVDNSFQAESVKNTIKETNVKRYGATSHTQNDKYKQKIAKINLEKYGYDTYFKTDDFKKKYKKTMVQRYGETHPKKVTAFKIKAYETAKRNGTLKRSWMEKELFENIQKVIIEAIPNDRGVLSGYELDIIIPSKKIAIEFNGRYWHKNDMDSLFKKELCEKIGWKLYVVKEKNWRINKVKEIEKCLEFIRNN